MLIAMKCLKKKKTGDKYTPPLIVVKVPVSVC
jgi:hypothetical protein